MPNLTQCLSRHSKFLRDAGISAQAIKDSAREYREAEGMSPRDAGIAAAEEMLRTVTGEFNESAEYVREQGGVVEQPNEGQRSVEPVAESQATELSESVDAGVTSGQNGAAPQQKESASEYTVDERVLDDVAEYAERSGVPADVADEIIERGAIRGASNDEIRKELAKAAKGAQQERGESAASSSEEARREEFSLDRQTPEDLNRLSAEEKEREAAEASAEKVRQQKEDADQERASFVLSGSDAQVDQAEARGQSNLFDAKGEGRLSVGPILDAKAKQVPEEDERIYIGNPDALSRSILNSINRTLKAKGYDVRGGDDILSLLKDRILNDGVLSNPDWVDAYRKAISTQKKVARTKTTKKKYKNINWGRLRELGITNDFREAGYINLQGRLIDLSGKRDGGSPGMRALDHREAGGTKGMLEVMDYGFVRMDMNSGLVDIASEPTASQYSTLRRLFRELRGEVFLDLQDGIGKETDDGYAAPDRTYAFAYQGRPDRIISDIKIFFSGKEPSPQVFSRARTQQAPESVANPQPQDRASGAAVKDIKAALAKGLGLETISRATRNDIVSIIHDPTQVWAGRWNNGRIELNAAYLPTDEATDVLLHESTHESFDFESVAGEQQAEQFQKDFDSLVESNDETAKAAMRKARESFSGKRTERDIDFRRHVGLERLPYFVEVSEQRLRSGKTLSQKAKNLYERISGAIKAWFATTRLGKALARKGIRPRLTGGMAVALARRSLKQMTEQGAQSQATQPAFSAAPKTSSPEFKAWFKDSKVVDENGKPLVVYKGMYPYDWTKETSGDDGPLIETINRTTPFPAFHGEEEGVEIAGFFGDKNQGSRFAALMHGAVYPVYLSIQNPLIIDAGGKNAGDIQFGESGKPFREGIRSGKYDGVIIRNTEDEGDVYVALRPDQIKSINNRGTFDPRDANILHSRRGQNWDYIEVPAMPGASSSSTSGVGQAKGIDIVKNPSRSDIKVLLESTARRRPDLYGSQLSVRMVTHDGNTWAWEGAEALHEQVIRALNLPKTTKKDQIFDADEFKGRDGPLYSMARAESLRGRLSTRNAPVEKQVVTGFEANGKPIIGTTKHASLKDRSALKTFWKKHFTKEGLLPDEVWNRKIAMGGAKNEVDAYEAFLSYAFKKSIKDTLKVSYRKMSDHQRDVLNAALAGEKKQLPKEVEDAVSAMRGHLDELSGKLQKSIIDLIQLRLEGMSKAKRDATTEAMNRILVDESSYEDETGRNNVDDYSIRRISTYKTIEANKGAYLNRSYQVFDDPNWIETVKKNREVMDAAKAHVLSQVEEEDAKRIEDVARQQIEEETPWQEEIKGNKGKDHIRELATTRKKRIQARAEEIAPQEGLSAKEKDALVSGRVNEILEAAASNNDIVSLLSSNKLGKKNLGILKRRKEVPRAIRDLLGEYKDPVLNYERSASKMAYLVANHEFLMRVREDGLGVFLSDAAIDDFSVPVKEWDGETMSPLTGLYSTPEFSEALVDATDPKQFSETMRKFLMLNAAVKYGKTVLSPITMARNFLSASLFTVMNGHFNWSHGRMSSAATVADLAKVGDTGKWSAYIRKLTRLGVLHNNVTAQEMWEAVNDAIDLDKPMKGPRLAVKTAVIKVPTKLYRAGDDFWKIIGFENERRSLMKSRAISEQEADRIAAERIRNGYPTYSHVPSAIRWLRRFPVLGAFVSFPWEIIRTTGHQFRFMAEDAKAGAKGAVARRAIGMSTVLSASAAASALSMAAMGIDDEDDEAVRAMGPHWQENSDLLYLGYDDNGLPTYIDLSHLDPYTYLKRGIKALMNGNYRTAQEKVGMALWETASPFLGWDIAFGTFMEIGMNKRIGGGPVYNEEASVQKKVTDSLNYARRTLQPGVISQSENMIKALQGASGEPVTSRSGKEYKLGTETAAWIGLRMSTMNPHVSLGYRAGDFAWRKRDVSALLNYPLSGANAVDRRDIENAHEETIKAHDRLYRDMLHAIRAAKTLGMTQREIIDVLKANGVGTRDRAFLIRGQIPKWRPSKVFLKRAETRAILKMPTDERRRRMQDAYRERREIVQQLSQ